MTDRAQFEAMLEALINEDQETAKDIFHNIVVGKSREIYEELLESDFSGDEEEEEETDSENPFDGESDDTDDTETDDSDETDMGDEEPDFGDDSDDEADGDIEDRVLDLEDALEELKAEFDELLAGEGDEPEHADMFGSDETDMGDEDPAFGDEGDGEDEFGADLGDDSSVKEVHHYIHNDEQQADEEYNKFMEYVNKVALPKHGDNGINNKSVVDNMKNNMGGTASNIVQGHTETKGGTQGGLLKPSTQPQTGGNINVPGGNAGKTAFKTKQPGGFGDNKGNKVVGAGSGKPNSVSGVNNKSITKRLGK